MVLFLRQHATIDFASEITLYDLYILFKFPPNECYEIRSKNNNNNTKELKSKRKQ